MEEMPETGLRTGTGGRRGPVALLLAFVGLVAVAIVARPSPAGAHATLVATEPAAGRVVKRLDRVVLRFEQSVPTIGAHVWLEDDGGVLSLGPATHPRGAAATIEVPVPAVASGRYTAGYHVIAGDGHVTAGSYGFAFEPPGGDDGAEEAGAGAADSAIAGIQPAAAPHQHPGEVPAGAARVLLDAALASLIGGLAFIVTVWPQGASFPIVRRLLWGSAIAAAVASLGLAVIQHA